MIGQLQVVNPTVSVRKFAQQQQKRSGGFLRFAQDSTAATTAAQSPFWRPDVPGEEQAHRVAAQQPKAASLSYIPRPAGWSALEQVSMETNESLQGFADNKRARSGRRFASALEHVSMMTNETLQGFAESKSSKGLRLFPAGGN